MCNIKYIHTIKIFSRKSLNSPYNFLSKKSFWKLYKTFFRNNSIASAGEDGSVQVWDCRKNEVTNNLRPHASDKVSRPRLGKWIGAVDFTDDWLVITKSKKQIKSKQIKKHLSTFSILIFVNCDKWNDKQNKKLILKF